jgi:MYXO-CTERM domain-containing protein
MALTRQANHPATHMNTRGSTTMRLCPPPLVAALVLCAPLAAWAGAGAAARVQNLQFTLVDLAPADGIAPSFAVVADPDLPNRLRTELSVFVDNTITAETDSAINAGFDFIAPLTLDRSVTGNTVSAASTATSVGISALSEARGRAGGFASAESNILFSGDFGIRLSPMTRLVLSADGVATAFDMGQPGALDHPFEFAEATTLLRVRGADPGDGSGPQDELAQRMAQTVADALTDNVDHSGALSVTFENLSAGDLYGYVSLRATVAAYGVTPVPEPASGALALLGLGALAAMRRRRSA